MAVLSAACRFVVRFHYQNRLFWDDIVLMVAIVLLCTSVGLWFNFVDDMYQAEAVS